MGKLKSRKFWLCIASLLGSVATAMAGFVTDNQVVIIIGVICGVASTAIYQILETLIDIEDINAGANITVAEIEENYLEDVMEGEEE